MASCHTHAPTFLRLPPTDASSGGQQSLLHQQSKRYPPTERTERTESSCREEPPTDGTDQHRSFVGGYGILPYPRTHIHEIASHRCKLRGCSSLCCTNKANGVLPQNAQNAQNLLAEKSLPQMVQINTDAPPGRNPWESTSQQVTTDRKADRYPSFSEYLSAFFLLIM